MVNLFVPVAQSNPHWTLNSLLQEFWPENMSHSGTSAVHEIIHFQTSICQSDSQECKNKAMEFASSQKLREEELDAIAKASEIIASSTVSGAAKHLESGGSQKYGAKRCPGIPQPISTSSLAS